MDVSIKFFIFWMLFQFFSLLITYSGNDKTPNGKKLKGYGFQMFSATFMFLPSLLGTTLNDTAKDIMFVLGVLIITAAMVQITSLFKRLLSPKNV